MWSIQFDVFQCSNNRAVHPYMELVSAQRHRDRKKKITGHLTKGVKWITSTGFLPLDAKIPHILWLHPGQTPTTHPYCSICCPSNINNVLSAQEQPVCSTGSHQSGSAVCCFHGTIWLPAPSERKIGQFPQALATYVIQREENPGHCQENFTQKQINFLSIY